MIHDLPNAPGALSKKNAAPLTFRKRQDSATKVSEKLRHKLTKRAKGPLQLSEPLNWKKTDQ